MFHIPPQASWRDYCCRTCLSAVPQPLSRARRGRHRPRSRRSPRSAPCARAAVVSYWRYTVHSLLAAGIRRAGSRRVSDSPWGRSARADGEGRAPGGRPARGAYTRDAPPPACAVEPSASAASTLRSRARAARGRSQRRAHKRLSSGTKTADTLGATRFHPQRRRRAFRVSESIPTITRAPLTQARDAQIRV